MNGLAPNTETCVVDGTTWVRIWRPFNFGLDQLVWKKMKTARLLYTDGHEEEITPKNGRTFTLEELYAHLDCDMIELARSQMSGKKGQAAKNKMLIIDEEGKCRNKPVNPIASEWYSHPCDVIAGHAILCDDDMLE